MMKEAVKRLARQFGVNLSSAGRIGVDMELDLGRLTAAQPVETVFDVGGNYGQTSLRFASEFPKATIFTFEPVPDTYKVLENAVRGHQRIRLHNLALGNAKGKVAINLTGYAGTSSVRATGGAIGTVEVPVDTVDSFAAANSVPQIDLLKMDVEGYELQVLEGARQYLQQGKIRYVYAECVFSEDRTQPHTSFFDLHTVLSEFGYSFFGYYAEGFRLSDGCAMGNVLYALRSKLPKQVYGPVRNIVPN